MAQVRIADLPTTHNIDPESFMIVEKPGFEDGTFKATVSDLQDAITVKAKVEQVDKVTTITIDDINGHTEETIVTPSAKVVDNGDNTYTITITDTEGVTETTGVSRVITDDEPTEGSHNFLTSGTIYESLKQEGQSITEVNQRLTEAYILIEGLTARIDNLTRLYQNVLTTQDEVIVEYPFEVNGAVYKTLGEAVENAGSGGTVSLICSTVTPGFAVPENSDFIFELNGFTLSVSYNNQIGTSGITLNKNSSISIVNGNIEFNDINLVTGIQNYSNLVLDNVSVSGGLSIQKVIVNEFGNSVFKHGSAITASGLNSAFTVMYGTDFAYDAGVNVRIEDNSVSVVGPVQFGRTYRVPPSMFRDNASITCPIEMNLSMNILNPPCDWTDNGDGTKTLRYSGET